MGQSQTYTCTCFVKMVRCVTIFMILSLNTLIKASNHPDKVHLKLSESYVVPWYCKQHEEKRNFIHFGAALKKEATLNYKYRGICREIKAALECGRRCISVGTSGYCDNSRILTKPRVARRGSNARTSGKTERRKCDEKEMACYILTQLWKSPASVPDQYAKTSPYSQPQCKEHKKRLTWIEHKHRWCKVVQPKNKAWIQTVWCDHKPCCVNKYKIWPQTKCKPSGWTKITFCVYCPGSTAGSTPYSPRSYSGRLYSEEVGFMDIVTRYFPQTCTCADNMCTYPSQKQNVADNQKSRGNYRGPSYFQQLKNEVEHLGSVSNGDRNRHGPYENKYELNRGKTGRYGAGNPGFLSDGNHKKIRPNKNKNGQRKGKYGGYDAGYLGAVSEGSGRKAGPNKNTHEPISGKSGSYGHPGSIFDRNHNRKRPNENGPRKGKAGIYDPFRHEFVESTDGRLSKVANYWPMKGKQNDDQISGGRGDAEPLSENNGFSQLIKEGRFDGTEPSNHKFPIKPSEKEGFDDGFAWDQYEIKSEGEGQNEDIFGSIDQF